MVFQFIGRLFFKNIQYNKPPKLPEVIGIGEFKGNSGGEKFHGILTDIGNRKVIDILKTRYEHDLFDYFKKYDRTGVRYFVSDMYKPYAEIAEYYFPNATYVIDTIGEDRLYGHLKPSEKKYKSSSRRNTVFILKSPDIYC